MCAHQNHGRRRGSGLREQRQDTSCLCKNPSCLHFCWNQLRMKLSASAMTDSRALEADNSNCLSLLLVCAQSPLDRWWNTILWHSRVLRWELYETPKSQRWAQKPTDSVITVRDTQGRIIYIPFLLLLGMCVLALPPFTMEWHTRNGLADASLEGLDFPPSRTVRLKSLSFVNHSGLDRLFQQQMETKIFISLNLK